MRRNIGIILIMILGIAVSMITAVFKFKYYSSYPAVKKRGMKLKMLWIMWKTISTIKILNI